MSVKVIFPDGVVREVSSVKRIAQRQEIGESPHTIDEPEYDPDWLFAPAEDGWRAIKR